MKPLIGWIFGQFSRLPRQNPFMLKKNVSNTLPHSGSKLQKPAKIRLKNFGKLTYLLCSCRNLITFEYEVDLNRKGKSIEICRKFVAWNL